LSKSNRRERIKFRSGVLGRLVDNCCSWDRGLAYPRVLRAGGWSLPANGHCSLFAVASYRCWGHAQFRAWSTIR